MLLQALIIELGLPLGKHATGSGAHASFFSIENLPRSLRQAKMLLKSTAFINIRDYLDVRGKGQVALQTVMHPSRKSLVRQVRGSGKRSGKRVPLGWVKETGLNVLLVNTKR